MQLNSVVTVVRSKSSKGCHCVLVAHKMFAVSRLNRLQKVKSISSLRFNLVQFYSAEGAKPVSNNVPPVTSEVLVYEGKYNKRMKWLRKVSFTSAVLGTVFLVSNIVVLEPDSHILLAFVNCA